jgi:hypothetical protein
VIGPSRGQFAAVVAAFNASVARATPSKRGAINGLAASASALAMAVGPAAASPAFAVAIHAFPPQASASDAGTSAMAHFGMQLEALLVNGVGLVFGVFALLLLGMGLVGCAYAREVRAVDSPG